MGFKQQINWRYPGTRFDSLAQQRTRGCHLKTIAK